MANSEHLHAVFDQLKPLLQSFAPQLVVDVDAPGSYALSTPPVDPLHKAIYFGGVHVKKKYVSYHLTPVYVFPALLDDLSPALRKRRQGKSCFNFTAIDPALLAELAHLTRQGYEAYKREYGV